MIDVDVLISAGLTNDQIVAVTRAFEDKRRRQNAERQQRFRDRRNAKNVTRNENNVANVTSVTQNGSFLSSLDSESKKERKERGTQLPESWVPSEEHFRLGASSLGMSNNDVLFHAEAMREWAKSNKHRAIGRKSDWNAAFSGWLRRQKPKDGLFNGHGGSNDWTTADRITRMRSVEERQLKEREQNAAFLAAKQGVNQ